MPEVELSPEERQALAIIADFVFRERYHTDWNFAVDISGASVDWDKHPRLIRSQSFGDPDYPSAILRLLKDMYQTDRNAARTLIVYVMGLKYQKIYH